MYFNMKLKNYYMMRLFVFFIVILVLNSCNADKKTKKDSPKMDQVLADIAQNRRMRENTYRARALKMFPSD